MQIHLNDPQLIAEFMAVEFSAEVRDAEGDLLGIFTRGELRGWSDDFVPPYTVGQMEEARQQKSGLPLFDILRDLNARKG